MINGVLASQYPEYRDRILPFLRNFCARDKDGVSVDDLEADILRQERQVWCINNFQALALTYIVPDAVRISHCGGVRRKEWQVELENDMKEWAKALGKKRVITLARPGWAPHFKARGCKELHREFMLEID